jgi:hypothetical protein
MGMYDWDDIFSIGVSIGWGVAIMCIVLGSLLVCCGVKKESKHLRMIGTIVGVVACFCYFIPIIAYKASEEIEYDEAVCTRCCDGPCEVVSTHQVKRSESLQYGDSCGLNILPMIVFYMPITIVLASVAVALACCICDPWCGPLRHAKDQERIRWLQMSRTRNVSDGSMWLAPDGSRAYQMAPGCVVGRPTTEGVYVPPSF